ncbi:MAG: acetylornithine transaminase [Actinobacteria bacterium]|nr:acetylornithine transaminase [Actinomycetota bacterium]
MTTTDALRKRWDEHILPTYGTPDLAFVRGDGAALFDTDDRPYLDFLSGLAVTSLGHAHPAVAGAVAAQAQRLTHTSNLFITPPPVELAGMLAEIAGWGDARVFFANSGAEANEAAIKLARRHGLARSPDKYRLVTLTGSFHGRTLATLEATGQTAKHAPFEPLAGYVDHVAWDDADAVRGAVDGRTSGVLLEVIQGEGGVRQVPDEVLIAAREACDEHDALLIVDEVQTGMGRTGDWFAWQGSPVTPDVMTLAKALANGLPIGACVARGDAADAFGRGDHASTFGGNPVSCAAAVAVIATIRGQDLVTRSREAGARLAERLAGLVGQIPYAAGVRGRGLLLGLELDADVAGGVETACRDRYLIVNAVAPDVVRFAPPLTVTDDEIDLAVAALTDALQTVTEREEDR